MLARKKIKIHLPLVICVVLFLLISVITISSAMTYLSSSLGNLVIKQLIWYLIGFLVIFFILKLSNQTLYQSAWYIYMMNILLLFLLLVIGKPINGSKCWFIFPGIGSIQPSEFMKIALILSTSIVASNWIKKLKKEPTLKQELILLGKVTFLFLIPAILTFLEPDTGAVFIYAIILISILWVSPLRKRWFLIGILTIGVILGIFLGIYFWKQDLFVDLFGTDLFYRIDRILDWRNGTGMQLENSLTAIGSSGILGHGYNHTPIYFPESGTDFIFAVYASNFGFLGSLVLLGTIFTFDKILIHLAKETENTTDKLIISGILGMLLYQQLQNIGMTLGILPITGITLPFISYGGSSLLSYLILVGLLLKIYNNQKRTWN